MKRKADGPAGSSKLTKRSKNSNYCAFILYS